MRFHRTFIIAPLMLAACIELALLEPAGNGAYVRSRPDKLWSPLPATLTDLNLPVESADKSNWTIRTQDVRLSTALTQAMAASHAPAAV